MKIDHQDDHMVERARHYGMRVPGPGLQIGIG